MSKYALVNKSDNIIENLIVCDSLELAQQLFSQYLVVEVPELENPIGQDPKTYHAHIGLKYTVDGFEQPPAIEVVESPFVLPTEETE